MTENKLYFYREWKSADFSLSDKKKTIVPVRLKNKFLSDTFVFNPEKNLWEKSDVLPENTKEQIPVEYVEFPMRPERPFFIGNGVVSENNRVYLEDFSPKEMRDYLGWRKEEQRYLVNILNYLDQDKRRKDYFSYEISVDQENLILTLSRIRFARKELCCEKRPWEKNDWSNKYPVYKDELVEAPSCLSENFIFNMKEGKVSFEFNIESDKEPIRNPWTRFYHSSEDRDATVCKNYVILKNFLVTEETLFPSNVLSEAYKQLSFLVGKYTGIKAPQCSEKILLKMNDLTMLPCEPNLYGVLNTKETINNLKINFKYEREDSTVLNKFLKKSHIRGYRILRKTYAQNPEVLLVWRRLYDGGFRDINLFNKVITNPVYANRISMFDRKALVFFSKYSISKRGEIATLNTLLKKVCFPDSDQEDVYNTLDALEMFHKYFRYVPEDLRKDILKDGFTIFNHDALSNISYRAQNKKIVFKYSDEQKNLEDDIDGYSFRLPENSYQMSELGTALHNCVAGYAESVRDKECTIVYAQKDDEYKICIEVRNTEVHQERVDRNAQPGNKEKEVLYKWHERHGLSVAYNH